MKIEILTEKDIQCSKKDSKKWIGTWPTRDQVKYWFDPQVDTKYVFRTPFVENVIAGIKKGVYSGDKYKEIKDCLMSIDSISTMRANAAGPIQTDEKGWREVDRDGRGKIIYEDESGQRYKLRTKNSYFTLGNDNKVSGVAQGNPIHSVMIGFKRGRMTGKLAASTWSKENPEKYEILSQIP